MRVTGRRLCAQRAALPAALLVLVLAAMLDACMPTQVANGPMPSMEPLSTSLVRGTSTRADVERLLGQPSGTGGSRIPPSWQTREIWFYQSVKMNGIVRSPPSDTGVVSFQGDMTQQVLLVFFAGDLYDGYMWYSNTGITMGKAEPTEP